MTEQLRITNTTVVDVATQSVHPGQTIVMDGERIVSIEPAATDGPPGVPIDGSGMFVCPGLIDSHVHFFLDAGSDPRSTYVSASDNDRMDWARRNARLAIEAGITTMRDCAAPAPLMFSLKDQIDAGEQLGPHIIPCGYALMRPRGHCHFLGGEVADVEALRRRLDWLLERGIGFVKLMASGGGLTPGTVPHDADLASEIMNEAAAIARANNLTITAHCHATASVERAIAAGLPMIEHASFVEPPGVYRYNPDLAQRIADEGIAVGPTVFGALQTARRFRATGAAHNPGDAAAVERLEGRLTNAAHFHKLGMKLMAGTDCGATDTPFDALVDELETYVEAGIPIADVVAMATSGNADLLRLDLVGEVKVGYRADLIMLSANPLETLQALRAPLRTIKAGRVVFDRAAGDAKSSL